MWILSIFHMNQGWVRIFSASVTTTKWVFMHISIQYINTHKYHWAINYWCFLRTGRPTRLEFGPFPFKALKRIIGVDTHKNKTEPKLSLGLSLILSFVIIRHKQAIHKISLIFHMNETWKRTESLTNVQYWDLRQFCCRILRPYWFKAIK